MVDLTNPNVKSGALEHGFNNYVFIIAGVFVFSLIGLFSYRLIQSLKDKESKKEQKRKLKEEKRKKK